MTKQGNFNQRTSQAKKMHSDLQTKKQQSDSALKLTPGTTNSVFTMMGPLLGTTQSTTTTTSAADLQRAPFTTPHQTVPETDPTEPPPAPLRNKDSNLEVDNLALEGVAPELAPSDFVSQNYETLATLMQEDNMVHYLDKTKSLIQGFDRFTIKQVPRSENKKADALSKIASTSFAHLSKQVLVEILKNKSISEMEISTVIEEQNPTWMTPIIEFISKGTLPHEQKDPRRIRRKAQRFKLRDGPRSVVARALQSGYYWPTMHRDARDVIKKCSDYQVHRPIPRQPQHQLTPITSPWPFYKWGIDIAGPFPVAAGGLKFLIVAIDYFTKWIEAKAVATITDLDLLEERRERAAICEAKAKSKMKGYYDAKVRGVSFRPGEFVYRANGTSHAEDAGKLGPKWEGPYEVTEALGNDAYKLRDIDGRGSLLGSSNGFICLHGIYQDIGFKTDMVALWNPAIKESVGIVIPNEYTAIGFGVCPETSDPKVVKINTIDLPTVHWEVEVTIDGFIYWLAMDNNNLCDSLKTKFIISYDLKSDKFEEVSLAENGRLVVGGGSEVEAAEFDYQQQLVAACSGAMKARYTQPYYPNHLSLLFNIHC
nr:reverse transcriptase domain-containing protein [Tanacetum cinerariifolium]